MMSTCLNSLRHKLCRIKRVSEEDLTETRLNRCLSTWELTAMGIGSTLGMGVYILTGHVAKDMAGPGVMISFLISAIVSMFSGLCYAEFGARVPKAGSAYVYAYVTVGEFIAFLIGWSLLLEYIIGTSALAKSISTYTDTLVNNKLSSGLQSFLPMNIPFFSPYVDLFAFCVVMLTSLIVAFGVKSTVVMASVLTVINLVVIITTIIAGATKADLNNWNLNETLDFSNNQTIPGGFLPYGMDGVFAGAATCFFAYVGFDVIATSGEEVMNPQRAMPISIISCLIFCFLAYFGVSAVVTLMVPYYLIDVDAPLPMAFTFAGLTNLTYAISIGSLAGLITSLIMVFFSLPRIIYAMAEDGLLFKTFTDVSDRFKTPVKATLISGLLAAVIAMILDLNSLVEMMSIGTLLAYSLVSLCVLLLRYKRVTSSNMNLTGSGQYSSFTSLDTSASQNGESPENILLLKKKNHSIFRVCKGDEDLPTAFSESVSHYTIAIIVICICIISVTIATPGRLYSYVKLPMLLVSSLVAIISIIMLSLQPENTESLKFKVPLAPLVCSCSIFFNACLMTQLSFLTWIRLVVWLILGMIMYFAYGIRHSKQTTRNGS